MINYKQTLSFVFKYLVANLFLAATTPGSVCIIAQLRCNICNTISYVIFIPGCNTISYVIFIRGCNTISYVIFIPGCNTISYVIFIQGRNTISNVIFIRFLL